MLDFSLAFNSVNFSILLAKLQAMGFSGPAVGWVEQYLTGRQQCVTSGKHPPEFSSWKALTAGVPAGSVLAPLLFSIYISDISQCLNHSRRSRYHLYADDFQTYMHFHFSELTSSIQAHNDELTSIASWAESNCLVLNPTKTQTLLLGSKRILPTIDHNSLPNIILSNTTVPLQQAAKNLGVMLVADISWGDHVDYVAKKVNGSLHALSRFKNLMSTEMKKRLIQSLIFPLFDYCDVVYQDISVGQADRLQKLQNRCVRFVLNLKNYREHISPYYQELSWLKLDNRRKFHTAVLTFKTLSSKTPTYLFDRFSPLSLSSHDTRNSDLLLIHLSHTQSLHSSFTVASSRLWNALPSQIRNTPTLAAFKVSLFRHLLSSQV